MTLYFTSYPDISRISLIVDLSKTTHPWIATCGGKFPAACLLSVILIYLRTTWDVHWHNMFSTSGSMMNMVIPLMKNLISTRPSSIIPTVTNWTSMSQFVISQDQYSGLQGGMDGCIFENTNKISTQFCHLKKSWNTFLLTSIPVHL
jgi:hypothetical protein